MENEEIPPLLHRQQITTINEIIQNMDPSSGSNKRSDWHVDWGVWFKAEGIQKEAIFCIFCGKFNIIENFTKDSEKYPNIIICRRSDVCFQLRKRF